MGNAFTRKKPTKKSSPSKPPLTGSAAKYAVPAEPTPSRHVFSSEDTRRIDEAPRVERRSSSCVREAEARGAVRTAATDDDPRDGDATSAPAWTDVASAAEVDGPRGMDAARGVPTRSGQLGARTDVRRAEAETKARGNASAQIHPGIELGSTKTIGVTQPTPRGRPRNAPPEKSAAVPAAVRGSALGERAMTDEERRRWEALRARQGSIFGRIEALECKTHKSLVAKKPKAEARTKAKTKGARGGATRGRNVGKAKSGRGGGRDDDDISKNAGDGDDDGDDPVGVAGGPDENLTNDNPESDPEYWEDTVSWLHKEMLDMKIGRDYPDILADAVKVLAKWRDTFPKQVWIRVIKSGRIAKELNECAPVIHHTRLQLEKMGVPKDPDARANVVDLCSGFGYMGMFLAEMLDSAKVKNVILVDKCWPMFNQAAPLPHQINWDHIYGVEGWKPTWPIALFTRKVNIKEAGQLRQMETHVFQKWRGPYIILAVHLCGTLSLKAVDMFNDHVNASTMVLKPCCLPEWAHTYSHDSWTVGKHCIPTREVCARGKWKGNRWFGPPRSHLRGKFSAWTDHLFKGIDVSEDQKRLERIVIQSDGGHQNLFVFADREDYATMPGEAKGSFAAKKDVVCRPILGEDVVADELRFPTAGKAEAGRWFPDGRGHGTHLPP